MNTYDTVKLLMILFYVAAAILTLSAVLLFFKLNIKDVMIRLSNKEEENDLAAFDTPVMATGNIENIAHEQQLTTMLDNKGRTVLLDEPLGGGRPVPPQQMARPATAPLQNAPVNTSANPNFKVVKNIVQVDTNETI
ncbi:MAG: hypothetical protein IJJ41_06815 [Clostridia bacterium]|nr:hypothetical protein [Clostridia bacterium]